MKFAWIPPGTFLMGSPPNEPEREGYDGADETQHKVTLTRGFWMGILHPVTRALFRRFAKETNYKTEAESGGGAYGWTGKSGSWTHPKTGGRRDSSKPTIIRSFA